MLKQQIVKKLLLFLLLLPMGIAAQTTPAEIKACPERSGGIYHSYEYTPTRKVTIAKEYVPFYISHFGRHGSRWHTAWKAYSDPRDLLRKAAAEHNLTPQGESVLARVETLAADADGRCGDLSPRGVDEQRGVAGRMFAAYPEVFSTRNGRICRIECRSTLVPRCILSMAAFNERLKELNPALRITRESCSRYLTTLIGSPETLHHYDSAMRVSDSMMRAQLDATRLMRALFIDPTQVAKPQKLMVQLFALASISQDVSYLDVSFYDLFTDQELYTLWNYENVKRYLTMGPSSRFGDSVIVNAKPMLRDIVEQADRVVSGQSDLSASLRFAHDSGLIPLLALMGVKKAAARVESVDAVATAWSVEKVSPMCANLQLIFYRNRSDGDVRVRVLHNESDAELPLEGGPYYSWNSLKSYFQRLYNN